MVVDITFDEVVNIHSEIQRIFHLDLGIKDKGLLESIIQRPNFKPYGYIPFRSIYAKCASLVEGIIKWHPFIDGNKRTGLAVVITYMHKNDYYTILPLSAVRFSVLIAQDKRDIRQITNWIRSISDNDYEKFNNKSLKPTLNQYQKLRQMYQSGSSKDKDKASKKIEKWLACDIYPEYRSQEIETINFITHLIKQHTRELRKQKRNLARSRMMGSKQQMN
jgi:death on curing protein